MTDRAIELSKSRLDKLSGGDKSKAIAILNQSIINSWQGLFELKGEVKKTKFSNFDSRTYDFAELERTMINGG